MLFNIERGWNYMVLDIKEPSVNIKENKNVLDGKILCSESDCRKIKVGSVTRFKDLYMLWDLFTMTLFPHLTSVSIKKYRKQQIQDSKTATTWKKSNQAEAEKPTYDILFWSKITTM